MARARNIKPAFFLNTDLSEIPALGRLAFIGLWTLSDYKGCIECNFKKIKAQILPYDECNTEELLNNLEQFRFIRYYFVQGKRYIKIANFERHQNPHKNEREAGSDIPDIDKKDNENNDLTNDGTKTDLIGSTRADSLLLIPDSLSLIPEVCESNCNLAENQQIEKTHTQIQTGLIVEGLTSIGIMPFNPQLPKLLALIDAGATVEEFVSTALEKKGTEKFTISYLLTTMTNRRQEAAQAKPLHQGALPNAPPKSINQKHSETAQEMFKMFNVEKENGRIVDVSDYASQPNRPLISANG